MYQYVFRGYRVTNKPATKEFVFEVQQSQDASIAVCVQLDEIQLRACSDRMERPLLPAEEYAIAKLTLFAGFDEADDPGDLSLPISPNADAMFTRLQILGRT